MPFHEKQFWRAAHKAVTTAPNKEAFIKAMNKRKGMVPHRPEDPEFFRFVMAKAWEAWHDNSPFEPWDKFRDGTTN